MKKDAKKRQDGSKPSPILASCRQSMRQVCSMDFWKERLNKCFILAILSLKRLPPLAWAPSYDLDMLTGDFIAGLTTALTVIPQGIGGTPFVRHCKFKIFCHGNDIYIFAGYAPLAGLPLQYGLYASIIPGFTYCLLGTTRQSLHT